MLFQYPVLDPSYPWFVSCNHLLKAKRILFYNLQLCLDDYIILLNTIHFSFIVLLQLLRWLIEQKCKFALFLCLQNVLHQRAETGSLAHRYRVVVAKTFVCKKALNRSKCLTRSQLQPVKPKKLISAPVVIILSPVIMERCNWILDQLKCLYLYLQ